MSRTRGGHTLRDTLYAATVKKSIKKKLAVPLQATPVSAAQHKQIKRKLTNVELASAKRSAKPSDNGEKKVSQPPQLNADSSKKLAVKSHATPVAVAQRKREASDQHGNAGTPTTKAVRQSRPRRIIRSRLCSDFVYDLSNE